LTFATLGLMSAERLRAAVVQVTPVADAYVNAANAATNYGKVATLQTDASPAIITSYLRFDVQNLAGPVTKATLRIYANTPNSSGYAVRAVADTTWAEASITYSSAPAMGATLGNSGRVTSGAWNTIDVTAAVSGNGLVSFGLSSPSPTLTKYSSREGAKPPQLVVETADSTSTTTGTSSTTTSTDPATTTTTTTTTTSTTTTSTTTTSTSATTPMNPGRSISTALPTIRAGDGSSR